MLLAGVVVVLAGWLLTPHPVPLYDGVGFPDEPYRYVSPPSASLKTAEPPGSAADSVDVAQGTNPNGISLDTGESGPQAAVLLPAGAIATAAGPVVAQLVPKAPTDQPRGAFINGNVYDLSMTPPSGSVRLTAKAASGLVELRAPSEDPNEVVVYRPAPGQAWKAVPTSRLGRDIWGSAPLGPGEYAVAAKDVPRRGASGGAGQSSGPPVWVWALGALVLVLLVAVVALRRRSPERLAGESSAEGQGRSPEGGRP
jgi:hypothetical protein